MKIAVIGSRNLDVMIEEYMPKDVDEIVSGGARGVDARAAQYAKARGIKLTEFLPQYDRFGRAAPLKRNDEVAEYADMAIAFWDGRSKGTAYTVKAFQKRNKRVEIILCETKG